MNEEEISEAFVRKAQMGALKWGLKATLLNVRTIVYNCALLWPFGPLSEGNFRRKLTTILGNGGQVWSSTLSPHLLGFHSDNQWSIRLWTDKSEWRPRSTRPQPQMSLLSIPVCIQDLIPGLVAPYRAILRYYRCDTPSRAILFKGG